jgi:hypothetical protein
MAVWMLRYALVFGLIGRPLGPTSAAAIALGGQAAMVLPIQIGLREWVVGLTSTLLPESHTVAGAAAAASLSPGLLADLINRAAELAVSVPLGLAAAAVLYRRWTTRREPAGGSAL